MFNRSSQPKSVGVVGDGDDVSIIEVIEDVFKVKIAGKEAQSIRTLEDAHSLICSKLPNDANTQTKCLTSMAYYRLNRAMQEDGKASLSQHIQPPTGVSPRGFQRQLEEKSGLKLDFLTHSSFWPKVVAWSLLWTWSVGPLVLDGFQAIVLSVCLVAVNAYVWTVANRHDERVWAFNGTLADLAKRAPDLNIGHLSSEGGKWRKSDVWKSMTQIISAETGFPAEKMRPAMTFFE